MLKKIPFIIFSFIFFLGIFILLNNLTNSSKPSLFSPENSVKETIKPTPEIAIGIPKRLIIPKLGVDTIAESVAMDSVGRMDVPKNVDNVAWYNLGPKPGMLGSAVMSGHLDKVTGDPAVFYKLDELGAGDMIKVVDEFNKEYNFKVTGKKTYKFDQVPLQQVFNTNDKPRLNLITCGGKWDQNSQNYSNRTVVYSEIIQ